MQVFHADITRWRWRGGNAVRCETLLRSKVIDEFQHWTWCERNLNTGQSNKCQFLGKQELELPKMRKNPIEKMCHKVLYQKQTFSQRWIKASILVTLGYLLFVPMFFRVERPTNYISIVF